MLINYGDNLEDKFGQAEIILGPMASAKSSIALMLTTVFREFSEDLNCKVYLFRPNIDTRTQMSRLGIEKDKAFIRVDSAKEITNFANDKIRYGKRLVLLIDEVEFLDSKIIQAVQEITSKGNYLLLSGLSTSFRGEPFPFSDYEKTMDDLLKIIPEQNQHTSKLAKCKTCRKTAEYNQRLINNEPAPYYDPLIRIDSNKDKAESTKKYSYEPRCKNHFYIPGKETAQYVTYTLKQNPGMTLTDITDLSRITAKIPLEITRQIIETMCAEKQAIIENGKIYIPPIIQIEKIQQ